MRIGEIVRIKGCDPIPELRGQKAEIVELQMQEYEKYRQYPIWAKMITGERADKIYGFKETEIELIHEDWEAHRVAGSRRVAAGSTIVEQLKEILKGVATVEEITEIEKVVQEAGKMSEGDTIRIKECSPVPDLVGAKAEIVELQMQEYEKYRQYPVWARVITGGRAGKIYGFKESEVEPVHEVKEAWRAAGTKRMEELGTTVAQQLEEILQSVVTVEELTEIEKVIAEAKGKIMTEPGLGFWEGKTPCWEMFRCPELVRDECPAYKYRSLACWEVEGTYCKLFDYGTKGDGTDVCQHCRVYKRWGQAKPIELKLLGKGFNKVGK